jgi:predicted Zn finger-like uncharacterized protein
VSTIIECPACSTRYKMNKDIPEGGRHVKCARCGNQWRLVPEGYVEETMELDEAEDDALGAQEPSPSESGRQPIAAHEPDISGGAPEPAGSSSWQSRPHHFADAISTVSEPEALKYGDAAAETGDETAGRHGWDDFDADEPSAAPQPQPDPARSYGFDPAAEPTAGEDEDGASEDAADASWASRMDRPWREIVEASRRSAEEEEEDAEAAIREALNTALEHPGEARARTGRLQDKLRSQQDDQSRSDPGWDRFVPRDMQPDLAGDDAQGENDEGETGAAKAADYPPFTVPGHDPVIDAEQADKAPFRLTGQSSRRPIDQAESRAASEDEDEDGEAAAALSAGFRNDIEDAFRAAPPPKRATEPVQRRDESLSDFDRLYDEQADGGQFGPEVYDDDATATLQAELESTDLTAYENRPGGGGLAMAAAWAVFFSIISGVALAVVTLRTEIMASLPGTAALYRAIGFDVAESGIDFADVSYRWTEAQGKPMIEVKGQVVNITDRRLTVPRVLINVRDGDNSDAVKVTASVPTESLAPRESASFTLEFVSPPKNISQIELEFDRNR